MLKFYQRAELFRPVTGKEGKEMNKLAARLSAVLMSVLLLCGIVSPSAVRADEKDFDEFLKDEWVAMMESDYTTMHFSVKDYRKLGLEKPELTLGQISYEEFDRQLQEAQKSLDALHAYDFNSLNERQQYDYLVYEDNLENSIALNKFPDYEEMFNPYTGTQSDLTTLLTEFIFYTKEDIDDYLVLLADYPRFMDDMLEFTKQQAAKGYFMTDAALDVELEQLRDLAGKGEEAPFIVIFNGRVDEFTDLDDADRQAYKDRNREIVLNQVFPCVERIADELEKLRGSRSIGDSSLFSYPDGKEYYAALMHMKISDEATPQEVVDYLTKAVEEDFSYVTDVLMSYGSEGAEEVITTMKTPTEMLDYLRNHMEGFPKGPELNYNASYLDPSVANPSVMAYYLTTPIDDVSDNVIRVNGTSIKEEDMNTLYYTLAHEGFPGHCYQFTWYYSQPDMNPLRHDLNMIGYTEGWAQYVEKIMLGRAPLSRVAQEYTAGNVFLGYTLQAAADAAVNGLGYDKAKLKSWAAGLGLGEIDVDSVYDAVRDGAGQILPYGYGLAKFWELRERTQSALGEEFDMEEYHLQILTNGPRSFDIVEQDLVKYVESKGKTMPEEFTFFASERTEDMTSIGDTMAFVQKNSKWILAAVAVIAILILILLFLLIRGIFRLITGKGRKRR